VEEYRPLVYKAIRIYKDPHKADDLTQGFFTKAYEQELFRKVDRTKGKFRPFLKTLFCNYCRDEFAKENANKRGPTDGASSLDALESPKERLKAGVTPEQAFDYAWASQIIHKACADVKAQCHPKLSKHWEVFRQTVVEPTLSGTKPPPLSALCEELGIKTPKRASDMTQIVKKKFRAVLRAHVREPGDSKEEVDSRIGELIEALEKSGRREQIHVCRENTMGN